LRRPPAHVKIRGTGGWTFRARGDAAAAPAAFNPLAVNLTLTSVATGLSSPVLVTHAGDGSGRLFIVEQTGKIWIIKGGTLLPTPFLSLSASILAGGEQGLLGLAFHPQFEINGKFYVYITLRNGNNAVNEYKVDPPFTADTARWQTGRRILTISHPTYSNHNGGNLAFGPDGYLYIGTGDGGSSGDPFNRSQNLNSFLGKILRINPNFPNAAGTRNYRIPQTNPYVGRTGLTRSGLAASATRGASRSTARRATCGSATSARTAGRRSTSLARSAAATPGAAQTTAGGSWRAGPASSRPRVAPSPVRFGRSLYTATHWDAP